MNQIAVNIIATGIIACPTALYMRGNILDIVAIISENIWQDQQLEKNFNVSVISTGAIERYIEKPATAPMPAIPSINNGATAPDANGRNEKNTIQNFFDHFIVFKYIIFCRKCDIIENIKYHLGG